jgi:hypothetical protein
MQKKVITTRKRIVLVLSEVRPRLIERIKDQMRAIVFIYVSRKSWLRCIGEYFSGKG